MRKRSQSNISNVLFLSASPLRTEQSDGPERAHVPHRAAAISEADHKCEVNNPLFQLCSVLRGGNQLCRKINASSQEGTFF